MRYGMGLGAAIALMGASCANDSPGPAIAFERTFGDPALVAQLSDPAIQESSGLARSHVYPGSYYTHNDSGDSPRFWRFDLKGKIAGPFRIQGADAVDWEDMASASRDGKNRLYFADIGDNAERRTSVQVYAVEEPTGASGDVPLAAKYDLRYPDSAHNAEAFLVDPKSGAFYIVTKSAAGPSLIFTVQPKQGGTQTMKAVGSVALGNANQASKLVTAGDFSPDGKYLVLRTYLEGFEYDFDAKAEWWKAPPRRIGLAAEIQGEAIAYSANGSALLTTSEFAPCPVSEVRIVLK